MLLTYCNFCQVHAVTFQPAVRLYGFCWYYCDLSFGVGRGGSICKKTLDGDSVPGGYKYELAYNYLKDKPRWVIYCNEQIRRRKVKNCRHVLKE
jgi:hypothetical protein